MRVKMNVRGMPLDFKIHTELNFDPENVFAIIGEQPGKLAWWTSLAVMRDQELADFATQADKRKAEIELGVRGDSKSLEEQYGKVTEGVIKAVLASNDEIVKLNMDANKLRRDVGILKAMAKGFETRSVLLATAGSAQKAEVEARLRSLVGKAKKDAG